VGSSRSFFFGFRRGGKNGKKSAKRKKKSRGRSAELKRKRICREVEAAKQESKGKMSSVKKKEKLGVGDTTPHSRSGMGKTFPGAPRPHSRGTVYGKMLDRRRKKGTTTQAGPRLGGARTGYIGGGQRKDAWRNGAGQRSQKNSHGGYQEIGKRRRGGRGGPERTKNVFGGKGKIFEKN